MEKKYCIYRHITLDTNKVFYIGIGSIKRASVKYKRSKYWSNIVNKHGYEIQILKSDLSLEDVRELEIILIAYYGRKDLGLGTLVNLTNGGDGINGMMHSIETRNKMSKSRKNKPCLKETKYKIGIANKSKKRTLETIDKIKIARSKQIISKESILKSQLNHAKSIKVINLKNNKIYNSISECARELNLSINGLSYQLKGIHPNKTTCKILTNE